MLHPQPPALSPCVKLTSSSLSKYPVWAACSPTLGASWTILLATVLTSIVETRE